jgi:hypothetical protein
LKYPGWTWHGVDGNDKYGNTSAAGRWQFNPVSTITISANFFSAIANGSVNDSPFALPAAFTSGAQYPQAVEGVTFHSDFDNPDQGRRNRVLVGSVRFSHQLTSKVAYSIAYQHVGNQRRNYNGPNIHPEFAAFSPSVNLNSPATTPARRTHSMRGSTWA